MLGEFFYSLILSFIAANYTQKHTKKYHRSKIIQQLYSGWIFIAENCIFSAVISRGLMPFKNVFLCPKRSILTSNMQL